MAPSDANEKRNAECTSTEKSKRRVNKPLIEKRRRERINECLNQLQGMITHLDKDKGKTGRPAKLEKADILEMTVEFVKKSKSSPIKEVEDAGSQYAAGYQRCIEEISSFFKMNKTVSSELQTSILKHVDNKMGVVKDEEHVTPPKPSENDETDTKSAKQIKCDPAQIPSNNVSIQPKFVPVASVPASLNSNPPICITTPHVVQNKVEAPVSSSNVAAPMFVCNRELPTFVLVPTATLCQSIQIPAGSQASNMKGLPVTALNTPTAANALSFNNVVRNDSVSNLSHPAIPYQSNDAQTMFISQEQTVPVTSQAVNFQPPPALNLPKITNPFDNMQYDVKDYPLNLAQPHPVAHDDAAMWRPW